MPIHEGYEEIGHPDLVLPQSAVLDLEAESNFRARGRLTNQEHDPEWSPERVCIQSLSRVKTGSSIQDRLGE